MKKYQITLFILLTCVLSISLSFTAQAEQQTNAVMSMSCDEAKIKELAGDALIKLVPQQWTGDTKGFNITLDTKKMSFADLTKKMLDAGCFVAQE